MVRVASQRSLFDSGSDASIRTAEPSVGAWRPVCVPKGEAMIREAEIRRLAWGAQESLSSLLGILIPPRTLTGPLPGKHHNVTV